MYYYVATEDFIKQAINFINREGFGDSIVTVFTIPALAMLGYNDGLQTWTLQKMKEGIGSWILTKLDTSPLSKTLVSTPSALDGYTPRNQKLRTYPYMYVGFNPTQGSQAIYRYEDFSNGTPQFKIISEVNPNPTVCFVPQNYRGKSGDSLQDVSTMQGYPTVSWVTDFYNAWLAQNSNIISLNMEQERWNTNLDVAQTGLGGIGNVIGNLAGQKPNIGGAVSGTVNTALDLVKTEKNYEYSVKQQMAQVEKQSLLPNSATMGSSNTTILGYDLIDDNIFTRYTIKAQYARRIDEYFDMYGYATNRVKVPNFSNRPNWNYVKTIGCNVIGNIPQEDLLAIKEMFDQGVTMWHNTSTFLDYSQNNR